MRALQIAGSAAVTDRAAHCAIPAALRLDGLEAFVAVAEELHFTRAARRLHLSQSGLSRRVAVLEARLGTLLLARTTRNVELTPAGLALLPHAQQLLADSGAAARALEQVARVRGVARAPSSDARPGYYAG